MLIASEKNGHLDIAKLLRSRGAKLQMCYEKQQNPLQPTPVLLGKSKAKEVRDWLLSCPPEGEFVKKSAPEEGEEFSDVPPDRVEARVLELVEIWHEARRIAELEEIMVKRFEDLEKKRSRLNGSSCEGSCSAFESENPFKESENSFNWSENPFKRA